MCSCPGPTCIQTSKVLLTVRFVGPCLCQWSVDFPGGCLPSAEGTLAPCFLFFEIITGNISLITHNLSLLSWCKLDSNQIDQGHGVTFKANASFSEVTKAYTSYLKNKKEKSSLTSKGGQASRYVEQFYQVWDEYFWMTPEKGQLITPVAICWEQKEQRVGFGDLH